MSEQTPRHSTGRMHLVATRTKAGFELLNGAKVVARAICEVRAEANMERLAACWNACEGIEDPAKLREQRDELLAALKNALSTFKDQHYDFVADFAQEITAIERVLAKAEGKAGGA